MIDCPKRVELQTMVTLGWCEAAATLLLRFAGMSGCVRGGD
jgi:hypothetical protein